MDYTIRDYNCNWQHFDLTIVVLLFKIVIYNQLYYDIKALWIPNAENGIYLYINIRHDYMSKKNVLVFWKLGARMFWKKIQKYNINIYRNMGDINMNNKI